MALVTNDRFYLLVVDMVGIRGAVLDAKLGPTNKAVSFVLSLLPCFSETREEPRKRTVTTVWNAAGLAFLILKLVSGRSI